MTDTDLFGVAEFARRIDMSKSWVHENAKTIPHHRVGRLLKFSEASVEAVKARTLVAPVVSDDPMQRSPRSRARRRK